MDKSNPITMGVVIAPPATMCQHSSFTTSDQWSQVLPFVMLWDPIQMYPNVIPNICTVEACSSVLCIKEWRIGQSQALQPRILHSVECIVLLVSPQYSCEQGHTLCCTDPRLFSDLIDELIPFVLLHRTGFTREFVHTVIRLLHEGLTARSIERFIQGRRQQLASIIMIQIMNTLSVPEDSCVSVLESLEKCDQIRCIQFPLPSNDIISK